MCIYQKFKHALANKKCFVQPDIEISACMKTKHVQNLFVRYAFNIPQINSFTNLSLCPKTLIRISNPPYHRNDFKMQSTALSNFATILKIVLKYQRRNILK